MGVWYSHLVLDLNQLVMLLACRIEKFGKPVPDFFNARDLSFLPLHERRLLAHNVG